MWSDPIADMLTRIRNGVRIRKTHVKIPSSKMKVGCANGLHVAKVGSARGKWKSPNGWRFPPATTSA